MNLHLLRDFAEAYRLPFRCHRADEASVIRLAEAAIALGAIVHRVASIRQSGGDARGQLAIEDRPMVERLRINAALRFARKLALLPPTEKT